MKKIIEFFKNRIVISVIGLLAVSIIVWFIGPMIKFGEDNSAPLESPVARLVVILILVVIWGLNNLRIQMQNKKHNDELVDDLQDNNASLQTDMTSDQTSEELHQLNERFAQALGTLKKLKFRGSGNNKALYELPWYIIIGPPGSGKTTALINSTLDFPLAEQFGKGALQGVGGTRNCDWWFTNDAVLIDTAGRYTTQDSHRVIDSSAWEGFLNLLKRNRRRRPINGAIVAISVQDLLTQSEEQRVAHAKVIRSRIDELMEKLEIRFPIYLMFTKCDLVSGFSEFFEDLTREEREQVWGVSLPNAPQAEQSPDFDYLSAEYQKLVQRIYDRELWRMHQERDGRRRGQIQGFPQQMENLRAVVESFVRQTFIKNRYRFQPYLRGIYFTSGTQEGTPIDRMMSSVSASFGFAREAVQPPPGQGKSFFLGRLFRDVMFPESELVGSNHRYELIIRWAQRGGYVGLAVLAVVILFAWGASVTRNQLFMSEVQSYIDEFHGRQKALPAWNKDMRAALPPLNALAKAAIVYDKDEHPILSGLGLYDGSVDRAAKAAYHKQLKELLLPRAIDYLESVVQQGNRGGDLYNTFRTYLMFNKMDHMNKDMVMDWFRSAWAQQLQGEATQRKELEAHMEALLSLENLQPVALNPRLVNSTRTLLAQMPVSLRIYGRIRSNPEFNRKIDMLNRFGESVREAYKIDSKVQAALQVPYMFTIEGYENIDLSPSSPVIADIVNDRWVLEDEQSASVDFVKEDLNDISEKVKGHYLKEYLEYWTNVYKNLDVVDFANLKQANDVLTNMTDAVYSPLLAILQVSSENTTLSKSSQALAAVSDRAPEDSRTGKAAGFLSGAFEGTEVDRQFRDVNLLLRGSEQRPAPINAIIDKIKELQAFIGEISLAPDPSRKSFEIAKARYLSGAGNAITTLQAFSKNTPDPVKRWLQTLAEQSWKVVLGSASQFVNAEWRSRVYAPYSRGLAGLYPLNSNARDELAMFDFTEFFKPTGTLDMAYQELLKPFIDVRKGWSNRVVDGYSMGFSSSAINQVQRGLFIKSVFFSNPSVPSLTFQIQAYRMDKSDQRFILELGDKRFTYSHGPKIPKTLTWSGADENKRVRVIFEDLNEVRHPAVYEGPWALFRLIDHANLKKTSVTNVYLATFKVNEEQEQANGKTKIVPHVAMFQIKARSVNNPFGSNLLGSFRCPESL